MESDQAKFRILIAEDDASVVGDYIQAFQAKDSSEDVALGELGELEADLFGRRSTPPLNVAEFDTVFCRQGAEALNIHDAAIDEHVPFDLALIDVRMPPGIDGIETAEQLRKTNQHIIIGIVTGYSDVNTDTIASRLVPAEKLFFVRKPFVSSALRQLVLTKLGQPGAGGEQ